MATHDPIYLSEEELLELHQRVIGLFGGMPGVRDRNALQSCLAQPRTAVFGEERFPRLADKAAAYCFFVVRSHPFFDGNKRTGFLAALHFLLHNGVTPVLDENEMFNAIVGVATGQLDLDEIRSVFRKSVGDF